MEDFLELAAYAVYDCEMPDGDTLAQVIHMSDLIHDDVPLADQLQQVRDICLDIAIAALRGFHTSRPSGRTSVNMSDIPSPNLCLVLRDHDEVPLVRCVTQEQALEIQQLVEYEFGASACVIPPSRDEREVLIRRIGALMLDAPLPDLVENMLQHREYGVALEELAAWINAEKSDDAR